jgi:hypothetical protein
MPIMSATIKKVILEKSACSSRLDFCRPALKSDRPVEPEALLLRSKKEATPIAMIIIIAIKRIAVIFAFLDNLPNICNGQRHVEQTSFQCSSVGTRPGDVECPRGATTQSIVASCCVQHLVDYYRSARYLSNLIVKNDYI